MDHDALLEAIRTIVARVVGPTRALPADMSADTPLAERGLWLDSVEILEVILGCEIAFAITFEPVTELVGDNLETLGTLAALIQGKNPRRQRV